MQVKQVRGIPNPLPKQQAEQANNPDRLGLGGEGGKDAEWGVGMELGLNHAICSSRKNEQYLIRILESYEIAQRIASSCHFTDFRSLSRVSRGLRKATFECMDQSILKQITCCNGISEDKSNC